MLPSIRSMASVPDGLVLRSARVDGECVVFEARGMAKREACPVCGQVSGSVHSAYERTLHDLPAHGRTVIIHVRVRRFRCRNRACSRRTFAESLGSAVDHPFGRRTRRSETLVNIIAVALGGRPGARLTTRLCLGWSRDTLLRTIRRHAPGQGGRDDVTVVGIDDWAWRRGQTYGTIICDLLKHKVLTLMPSRDAQAVERWLKSCPNIVIVARDRGGEYARAATRGAPNAVQVADRWHLMANASQAFLDAIRQQMRRIRAAVGAGAIDAGLLTHVERRQLACAKRREAENDRVLELHGQGMPLREIARTLDLARHTVRRVVKGQRTDVIRPRRSALARFEPRLEAAWAEGCHNGAELWRRLQSEGFSGSLRVVTEWVTRRRRQDEAAESGVVRKCPSSRTIAKHMTTHRDRLMKGQAVTMALIEKAVPELVQARDDLDAFHTMVRDQDADTLEPWMTQASTGLLASFVNGLRRDLDAVRAALTHPWSSGQVEGQNTKVKAVKRQMYGRGNIDLLFARVAQAI